MSDTNTPQFWVLSESEAYEETDTFRGMFSTLELAQAAADKLVQLEGRGGWKTKQGKYDQLPAGRWTKMIREGSNPAYTQSAAGDFQYWIEPFAVDQLCNYQADEWRIAPDEKDEQE